MRQPAAVHQTPLVFALDALASLIGPAAFIAAILLPFWR